MESIAEISFEKLYLYNDSNEIEISFDSINLLNDIEVDNLGSMKSGVWLCANTMPWFRDNSTRTGKIIRRINICDDNVKISVPKTKLKDLLNIKLFPSGTSAHTLTLIHKLGMLKIWLIHLYIFLP